MQMCLKMDPSKNENTSYELPFLSPVVLCNTAHTIFCVGVLSCVPLEIKIIKGNNFFIDTNLIHNFLYKLHKIFI